MLIVYEILKMCRRVSFFLKLLCFGAATVSVWLFYALRVLKVKDITLLPANVHQPDQNFRNSSRVTSYHKNDTFLLSNDNVCQQTENLSLIILIHSKPDHFEHRRVIRQTWGNNNITYREATYKRLFLFGAVESTELQNALEEEHQTYGDTIQGNFVDSYQNLVWNTWHGFRWVRQYCKNAKVVMKMDDDVIVNMYLLMRRVIEMYTFYKKRVLCNQQSGPILRDPSSKFYVPENIFPGMKKFPTYCEGKAVIYTADLVQPMLDAVAKVPMFWIEDIYFHGLVLKKIEGVKIDKYRFRKEFDTHCHFSDECFVNNKDICTRLFIGFAQKHITNVDPIWKLMTQTYKSCQ